MAVPWEESVRAFAEEAGLVFGADLVGIFLFGSRARGDHRDDSDADIALVLSSAGFDFWKTKEAVGDIAYRRLLSDGIYIQAMPFSANEWDDPRAESVVSAIKIDAKPLFVAA